MGTYSYAPKKLDLDIQNRTTLTKTSIEEPPLLEMKVLIGCLHYAFLGENSTLNIIVATNLV